ncbi:MAG: DNA mismatch repair protein MutS [Acidobacteria bacterium]|jgi:DNA mismatch repair protein MutS|nr:MAG: DNA mismatch repair protein MutS [Acidobacteriota bacterium]GIU81184.1 MAG: DNA mismatch repair protein MutS [Pyrinomonadaceae bacterium]
MQNVANITPMLRQYLEIKKKYPGILLFFRLGDFYELFNEDAIIGSRELEITLTARHKDTPNPIPMCGVPYTAASTYIAKLIKKGYKVAICEQVEQATKNKKLVRREVVRVITPGTAVDSALVEPRENLWLASVCGAGDCFGAAFLEISTGEFLTTQIKAENAWERICQEIESFDPRELLFPESLRKLVESRFSSSENPQNNITLTALDNLAFHLEDCKNLLKKQFQVRELSAFEIENKVQSIRAAGAVLDYAHKTQRTMADHVSEIKYFEEKDYMVLDTITLRNLEIIESRSEQNKKTLFSVIDQTITGMGARLLKSWLLRPCIKKSEIETRLEAVSELTDLMLREKIRSALKEISDLERLIGKLNLGTITPRELRALAVSLAQVPKISHALSDAQSSLLTVLAENIHALPEIQRLILDSINEDAPANVTEGGVIKEGFSSELDELRKISLDGKKIIASFEEEERKRTGILNLKVKFNNVFGYFIEVSKGNLSKVPADYERRQTLTNAERFTTPKLKEWEQKVLSAEERIKELEVELFSQIRQQVQKYTKTLQTTARALATLDALQSLAETAVKRNYVMPILHEGDEIEIKQGRHAIVEVFSDEPFVPNDIYLNNSTDRLLIITGPNMGGKSTILRQVALIQILAQIGSFVPASSARLPIVDRIWTRVGASDDLASGRSTFMVEMTETATILHNATPRSLVLLDEIGRGTSTFDGLSIAWAVAEYLHNSPEHSAKTLFATHYHELTELAEILPGAKNYQITAVEKDGKVIFLHKLEKGKASKSYGIAVAQLAGLPQSVIKRAREVLNRLEKYELAVLADEKTSDKTSESKTEKNSENKTSPNQSDKALKQAVGRKIARQISLFAIVNEQVVEELRQINPETLSDAEAKQLLIELKSKII